MSVEAPRSATTLPGPGAPPSRRPLIAGLAAGLWSLVISIAGVTCVVMVAWAVAPNASGDAAAAWRASGLAWLGAHLVPITLSGRELSLLPAGALLLGLLLGRRAGRWAGRLLRRPTLGEAVGIVVAGSMAYGVGGAGIAWLSASSTAGAHPAVALLGTGVVAAAGLTWGLATEGGLVAGIRGRVGDGTWRTLRAGLAAALGLFAAGSALLSASLVVHVPEVAGTIADLDAGLVGTTVVTLLCVLCLPTMGVWAMALLVGPGFTIGATGALSAFGGEVGSLPALPVLAAIPTTAPPWAPVLLVVPVALGVLAGRIRWGQDLPTLSGALLGGAGVAAVVAIPVTGMMLLATGSLGGQQLADVGPAVLPAAAAATGLVTLGFLLEAGSQSVLLSWDLYRAAQRTVRASAAGLPGPAGEGGDPATEVPDDAPVSGAEGPEVVVDQVDLTDGALGARAAASAAGDPAREERVPPPGE